MYVDDIYRFDFNRQVKVKELIEALEKLPEDAVIEHEDDCLSSQIYGIRKIIKDGEIKFRII